MSKLIGWTVGMLGYYLQSHGCGYMMEVFTIREDGLKQTSHWRWIDK